MKKFKMKNMPLCMSIYTVHWQAKSHGITVWKRPIKIAPT